jgi:hypothetical protein
MGFVNYDGVSLLPHLVRFRTTPYFIRELLWSPGAIATLRELTIYDERAIIPPPKAVQSKRGICLQCLTQSPAAVMRYKHSAVN